MIHFRLRCGALLLALLPLVAAPETTLAQETSQVLRPAPGVAVVLDDNNDFGGMEKGTTHQNEPAYQIEKTLFVPADLLGRAKVARVRVFLHVFDYSYTTLKDAPNGLDESFEVRVNGNAHVVRHDSGVPARLSPGQAARHEWYDLAIPVAELRPGANAISIRKSPSPGNKNDDFLYIGIDNSVSRARSRSSLDGGATWRTDKLNVPGAGGEYMIRLALFERDLQSTARWTPQGQTDPNALIGYATANAGTVSLELDAAKIDAQSPLQASVRYRGATTPQLRWLDASGTPLPSQGTAQNSAGLASSTLPAVRVRPARLEVVAPNGAVSEIALSYALSVDENATPPIDMAPRIAAPIGKPLQRAPRAALTANGFVLENGLLRAEFSTKPALKMLSLRSEHLQKNVLAHPEHTRLFLTEIGDARLGAEDWIVQSATLLPAPRRGVEVALALPARQLSARFTLAVDEQTLRFGLNVSNTGPGAQSWKTAFPHLGGLVLSPGEAGDHYLFPYRGGIIADAPANLRTVYGEQTAWWQMMDVFSPSGGAGLSLRADDTTGLYKSPALRKGLTVATGASKTDAGRTMLPEFFWQQSLPPAPGTALTFEYLRRTRATGQGFAPPDAVLQMHAGDWHTAMQNYANWARRVWKWRAPNPKLRDVWNITTPGWGKGMLFRDGKYRTDYIAPQYDGAELQSWWSPSELAPWGVPVERAREELGAKFWNQYLKDYIVSNPATGALQYRFNPGDYTGYNPEWGGLPAFRAHLARMKEAGQVSMLYTCPPLADWNTETGRRFGPKYGAINPRYKDGLVDDIPKPPAPAGYIGAYAAWNINPDNAETPDYLAAQMKRIIQETGADGLRLDVFGYQGYVDENPNFKRLFAEPGHNAYLQATTNATAKIRAALDEVNPDTILTIEFPGYDHLARFANGSIVYETGQSVLPGLRPVPANLFRFYFPEFKTYDLDNLAAAGRAQQAPEWRFWNAMGAFGIVHPPLYHRTLEENGDVFNSLTPEPLIPTLVPRVYANRFTSGAKSLVTLYNARPFTVDEPLLSLNPNPNTRFFDLLNGREIVPTKNELRLKLAPSAVACVATLPRRLSVQKGADGYAIRVSNPTSGMRVALCAADGTIQSETTLMNGAAILPLTAQGATQNPAYVKLFAAQYLVDAAELPDAAQRAAATPVAAPVAASPVAAPVAGTPTEVVYGDAADFNRAFNGAGVGGTNGGLVIGKSPALPAGGRNAIAVFDLSAYRGKTFSRADMGLFLTARDAKVAFNADLYAAGYAVKVTSDAARGGIGAPPASSYFEGAKDAGATLIQNDFLTPASPIGAYARLSESGQTGLLAFLNARGDNDFVLLRLSPDAPLDALDAPQLYSLAATENQNTFADPMLNLTVQP